MKTALRITLFLTGCVIIWLGLNVGLGGIQTMGWRGAERFIYVTNDDVYAVRDNHIRFIAGVWMTVGVLMIIAAFHLVGMRDVLLGLMAMIFMGGLMRLSSADVNLLGSMEIAPSLIAELILFPILGYWIFVATRGHADA